VETENEEHLARLPGVSKRFTGVDQLSSTNSRAAAILDACSPAPKDLVLKVGAQVMLCKTLDQSKGLVNGSRGVVTAFHPLSGYPMVRFQSGTERVVTPELYSAIHNGTLLGTRTQLPLTLSWAMSIHKSQVKHMRRLRKRVEVVATTRH
jgi:ATP-dependent DNA helicase PIF1